MSDGERMNLPVGDFMGNDKGRQEGHPQPVPDELAQDVEGIRRQPRGEPDALDLSTERDLITVFERSMVDLRRLGLDALHLLRQKLET